MSRWYIDTSAATKLLVDEDESAALAGELDARRPDLVASYLLETEIRRVVHRVPTLTHESASRLLDSVGLYECPPSLFRETGLLPGPGLPSLDPLHLATAVRVGVDAVLAYDRRMGEAARALGLTVVAPGASDPTVASR
ncbi:type II toxin-antitoxin system VapC family toxin [Agilicoccus flavus]|uniref:type II toxin-antitoxin system VapC family toxin n=1 Tax=Agilicoccus flavus TaxID=2775968 RepID=UPI001CF6BE2F|nr:type II toxin-antitoxin system VapC family toxin [Agilicoccus flavus]